MGRVIGLDALTAAVGWLKRVTATREQKRKTHRIGPGKRGVHAMHRQINRPHKDNRAGWYKPHMAGRTECRAQ